MKEAVGWRVLMGSWKSGRIDSPFEASETEVALPTLPFWPGDSDIPTFRTVRYPNLFFFKATEFIVILYVNNEKLTSIIYFTNVKVINKLF